MSKARAQGCHRRLVEGGKKTGQGRAMGQLVATKEGHERFGKWLEPFVKCGSRVGSELQHIANENHDKIDEVVLRHPRARVKRTCS